MLKSHTNILIFENLAFIKLTPVIHFSCRYMALAIAWKPANKRVDLSNPSTVGNFHLFMMPLVPGAMQDYPMDQLHHYQSGY